MATDLAEPLAAAPPLVVDPPAPTEAGPVYDRSSLPGDYLVMIAGQTEADYLRLAPDKQFCEFIDGIVYMPPRVDTVHQINVNFLVALLLIYHSRRPVGFISTGPVALRLSPERYLEPDLFVVPEAARAQAIRDTWAVPPVLLVIEILSPSNRNYDLKTKAAVYREALVDEVWFVDRTNQVVVIEQRDGDGPGYTRREVSAGPIFARSLAGFWFDAAWLWQEPEPPVLDCALLILAGPPGAA